MSCGCRRVSGTCLRHLPCTAEFPPGPVPATSLTSGPQLWGQRPRPCASPLAGGRALSCSLPSQTGRHLPRHHPVYLVRGEAARPHSLMEEGGFCPRGDEAVGTPGSGLWPLRHPCVAPDARVHLHEQTPNVTNFIPFPGPEPPLLHHPIPSSAAFLRNQATNV